MDNFASVPLVPADPILGLTEAFLHDTRKEKVNLGVGLYKDATLVTPILQAVKEAEKLLLQSEHSKEYLPITGDPAYLSAVGQLVFGKKNWEHNRGRIASFQAPGGTGALKIGATFLKEEIRTPLLIPEPSWPNHRGVFREAGLQVELYPYYDIPSHRLLFEEMVDTLQKARPLTVPLFHACCHNPTGMDPAKGEWEQILSICQKKSLLPFFDFAYQGLGTSVEEDAFPIRHYLETGKEMLIASSYSKNLGLYDERVGALFIVCHDEKAKQRVVSRVKQMIRTNYSNPPSHGAKVAALVLGNTHLYHLFEKELTAMRERIVSMRQKLVFSLSASHGHIKSGKGLFAFLGLHESQVALLRENYGIYMPSDGRINVCGLTDSNLSYVVEAIKKIT